MELPKTEKKRLFFAFNTAAPWPKELPGGRILAPEDRHVTVAFLGNVEWEEMDPLLDTVPAPPFTIAPVGRFTECLYLPPRRPRAVAWNVEWLEQKDQLFAYQQHLVEWLTERGIPPHGTNRRWLPHTTMARGDFNKTEWLKAFRPLPMMVTGLHLYESLGHSRYRSVWHHALLPAFEQIDQGKVSTFLVRGDDLQQLYLHALTALQFVCPKVVFPKLELPLSAHTAFCETLTAILSDAQNIYRVAVDPAVTKEKNGVSCSFTLSMRT